MKTPPPQPPPPPPAPPPVRSSSGRKTAPIRRGPADRTQAWVWSIFIVFALCASVGAGWIAHAIVGQARTRQPTALRPTSGSPTLRKTTRRKTTPQKEAVQKHPTHSSQRAITPSQENAAQRLPQPATDPPPGTRQMAGRAGVRRPLNSNPSRTPPTVDSAPAVTANPAATAAAVEQPQILFQDLRVLRRPTLVISGLPVEQTLQYRLVSQLVLDPRQADGRRTVDQVIESVTLEKADDLSRATYSKSLSGLVGQQFTFTLNRHDEVVAFRGYKDTGELTSVDHDKNRGFLVTSVKDEDGWKEITQLCFFRPKPQFTPGESWLRQMTHDWGALGSWYGDTRFTHTGKRDNSDQFKFVHTMKYLAADKTTTATALPFEITKARFEPVEAGGEIRFNPQVQRVVAADEVFYVRGLLQTVVLGQPSTVRVEERQEHHIRLSQQRPTLD